MLTSYELYADARRQEMERSLRRATFTGRALRDVQASTPSGLAMGTIRRAFRGAGAARPSSSRPVTLA